MRLVSSPKVYRFSCRLIASIVALVTLVTSAPLRAQAPVGHVDIFAGIDLHYRDVYYNGRVFDILLNIAPGVRWQLPYRTVIAGQVLIPIVNQYGYGYGRVQPGAVSINHQRAFGSRVKMKFSAGLFTLNRYGLDVKAMVIANKWLSFVGEVGLTGMCAMAYGWQASTMKDVMFIAGPDFWISPWNVEFKALAGRYTFGDYGVTAEAWRHFRHVSIGVYGSYGNVSKENAGLKICVALPPYKRRGKHVTFRPESTFNIGYNNRSRPRGLAIYDTEPEQNARFGWFDRDLLPWGPDTMRPEFIYTATTDAASDQKEKPTEDK